YSAPPQNARLVCTRARRHLPIWHDERKCLITADRKEHAVALKTADRARFEISDERELPTDERLGLRHIRRDAGNDLARTRLFIKIDREPEELVGLGNALCGAHRADLHFYLREFVYRDARFTHDSYEKDNW